MLPLRGVATQGGGLEGKELIVIVQERKKKPPVQKADGLYKTVSHFNFLPS